MEHTGSIYGIFFKAVAKYVYVYLVNYDQMALELATFFKNGNTLVHFNQNEASTKLLHCALMGKNIQTKIQI